jgi:hypothetical protein
LYGLAAIPAGALSPTVAGLAFGVGVGIGYADGAIGGGVEYGLGQIDPIMPAELNVIGGFARLTTPIMLLYRMLLGSALAKMGLCASAPVRSLQRLAVPPLVIVEAVYPAG